MHPTSRRRIAPVLLALLATGSLPAFGQNQLWVWQFGTHLYEVNDGSPDGLYLHSTAGTPALPFHGGFLCLGFPIKRHAGTNISGASGTCSGVLAEDFNAYVASGADPALAAGSVVWIQAWSRDPAALFGDSISDAVSATICP